MVAQRTCDDKNKDYKMEFLSTLSQLTYRYRAWDIWKDFVVMLACAFSNSLDKAHYDIREKRYLEIIQRYSKEEQELFPKLAAQTVMALEENPEQDFLGNLYMELGFGDKSKGQNFTPYSVCRLAAEIAFQGNIASQIKEQGYITIHDPCCGAGAMLIAGIHIARQELEQMGLNFQNHVLIAAQDIDETVALMCYIQMSLLGIAGYIKIGNALTDPMAANDCKDNYWYTPMYFSRVWVTRRLLSEL